MMRLELLQDEIGRKLAEAESSGELKSAADYGKPLREAEGWSQTPDELRMPFKILKDAGVVPPEVELFHERARLRAALDEAAAAADETQRQQIRKRLSELEQSLALRLEALKRLGGPT
jgi:hypothetical protein